MAALAIGPLQEIAIKHHHKKILGHILGILGRVAALANVGKDRPPINPAELGERLASLAFRALEIERGEDEAPASGREAASATAVERESGCHPGASSASP